MEIELTKHQLGKMNEVLDSLHIYKMALLSGISGTGKTTLTREIIKRYKAHKKTVHLTATTHKALEVVSRNIYDIEVSTIHSFLNLVKNTRKAGAPFERGTKLDKKTNLLIIDEFSMLTEDVIKELNNYISRNRNTEVLFVGDASQLVLSKNDIKSIGLEKYATYLTEPMRQGAMSDIAIYSKMVSENILGLGPEVGLPWGEDVIKYTDHKEFISAWKQSKTKDKVILAFKNSTVQAYNRNIAKYYRGQAKEYENGNMVVLRGSVKTIDGNSIIPNRRTIEIINATEFDNYWMIESAYGTFLSNKTKKWLDNKTDEYLRTKNWSAFYSEREKYVQLHHADSMTCHSAQGEYSPSSIEI